MKRRQWRKKKEDGRYVPMVQHGTNYETLQKKVQHERRERGPFAMVKCETGHEKMCAGMSVCYRRVTPLLQYFLDRRVVVKLHG